MIKCLKAFILTFSLVLAAPMTMAQEQPKVGRDAAARYFQSDVEAAPQFNGGGDHYLALHLVKYMSNQAYEWKGTGKREDVGEAMVGLTYRVGEWYNSMDLNIRIDFQEFDLDDKKPLKMSLMPLITFPDAGSRFPLYFGAGAGLGVFFKQVEDESSISLDYQLVLGARFFDVFENTGFFIESGLKNHLHLLSSGQLNGTFLTLGAVFTF